MTLYFVIAVLVLFVLAVAFTFFRDTRKGERIPRTQTLYYEALNQVLQGDTDGAYKKLRSVVEKDSGNVDAYLHIGNILRQQGDNARALKVHRNLLHRSHLTPEIKNRVLKAMAADCVGLEDYPQAIATLEQLTSFWKKDTRVYEQLLVLYEKTGQWHQAFTVKRQLLKQEGKKEDSLLALYLVQEGLALAEKKEEHKARQKFQEALNVDSRCAAAYLHRGHSHFREGDTGKAVAEWKNLVTKLPEYAYLAFLPLGRALYEKGEFNELESLYRSVLQHHPQQVQTLLALAEVLAKKGEHKAAIQLCQDALAVNPRLMSAYCQLLRYQQNNAPALEETLKKLNSLGPPEKVYICQACRYRSPEPLWRCPQCEKWQTFGI
jgi:lipopolysaccharide biosynthesis regulator YciM